MFQPVLYYFMKRSFIADEYKKERKLENLTQCSRVLKNVSPGHCDGTSVSFGFSIEFNL